MVTYVRTKMSYAKKLAKKRREQGYNATIYKRKKRIKVSVTQKKKRR